MENQDYKKIVSAAILILLAVLSFFLIQPILMAIIIGTLLAFICAPVFDWTYKRIKNQNISAALICLILILILITPIWILTPTIINQSIKVYMVSQEIDYVTPLKTIFPSIFSSDKFSTEVGSMIHSFVTKLTNSLMNSLSNLILNFTTIFLQSLVVFFTFFFVLRDRQMLVGYIKSLLPFSKDVERKLFDSSRDITMSVLYGQVIIGILQGIVAGLGFFIFGVPNALLLSLLACIAGIFPIIGTTIVWLPTAIYLFIADNTFSSFGVVLFGLISSSIDNFLRPIIVSKRAQMHSAIVLIGMIGGLFLFGVLGFILGPLILAYLFILLEVYRRKNVPGIFIKPAEI